MRVVTLISFVNLTFATCRDAELGFLGLIVVTLVTIPFTWGRLQRAGVREKPVSLYFNCLLVACLNEDSYTLLINIYN